MKNKNFFTKFCSLIILAANLFLTACAANNSNQIVIGNFQSYISPWLANNLEQKYNLNFSYFNSGDEVISRYKVNAYDASIVSNSTMDNLIQNKLVKKINWAWFNLKKNDHQIIKNSTEALELYTKPVQEILTKKYKTKTGEPINLLDYGIPYFLQTFNFAYRGNKINELHPLKQSLTWKEMLEIIGKQKRFHSINNKHPQLALIDDPQTVMSASQLMNPDNHGVNPLENARSISNLENAYKFFVKNGINRTNLGNNPVLLNSDSNLLLNELANPPKTIGSVAGGFLYNGDILFAANGGDQGFKIEPNDFHIVKNKTTLYALDLFNFSNKIPDQIENNKPILNSKLDRLYKTVRSLALEGSNANSFLEESEADPNLSDVQKVKIKQKLSANCNSECITYDANLIKENVDDESTYKYGAMINFNYVQYTPPLKKMYNQILGLIPNEDNDKEINLNTEKAKLYSSNDLTLKEVEPYVHDSYFYTPPDYVFFGKKDDTITDFTSINLTNWKQFLSVANFNNKNDNDSDPKIDKKLILTNIKTDPNFVENKIINITYKIHNINDGSVISENTQNYNLTKTANENYEFAKIEANKLALLKEEILVINNTENLPNFVEVKLDDLTRSNLIIAYNELKNFW